MKEATNILRIFKEARDLIKSNKPAHLKSLSNQTIHSATIYQDPDNIMSAVLVYSLSKILQRNHYRKMAGWDNFYKTLLKDLDIAITSLEKNKLPEFRRALGRIRNSLNKISSNLKEYTKDVFRKAEINKAFKIYEHGISAEKTAELLGINLWDLASYIGQSSISEAHASQTLSIKERIKYAEEIFK